VDDLRIGSAARAIRHRMRFRQVDVAAKAGLSQQIVSLFERAGLTAVDLATARRICAVLGMRLDVVPRWRGADLYRLLDEAHAALVNEIVRRLQEAGWETIVEWSFSHFGERGSIDVVGWRPGTGHLVVVEAKSQIVDTQEMFATHDRKVRLAAELLPRERGWQVQSVSRLLVVAETSAARAVVAKHAATFDAALPVRGRAVSAWLRNPTDPIRGLLFLRDTTPDGGTNASRRRVRR
jgi:transcriptional regulator with XRE-family HTH domain